MNAQPYTPALARPRRVMVLGLAALSTGFASVEMHRLLAAHGTTVPELFVLGLFAVCFAWIALSFWSGVAGFIQLVANQRVPGLRWPTEEEATGPLTRRTAVVMPVYNEDPSAVFAHVQATYESIAATGQLDAFDFYVLSDSTRAESWVAEELAWSELCRRVGG
ncbi:glucans biosynthesis glucosyltransferase MdoH, partial [Corallococcus sp. AB018]